MKIAILSAFHETNTFSTVPTDKKNFTTNTWQFGDEILKTFSGTRTPIGGFIDAIKSAGHEIIPMFAAHATPAGTVQRKVFDEIRNNFKDELLKNSDLDAVALELHGAHVVEGLEDPEAVLLADIKKIIGNKPIAVVTDFHANMSVDRLNNATVWAGYGTNPHVDTYEAGIRCINHLLHYLEENLKPEFSFVKVPILYPPIGQSTSEEPFIHLVTKAQELKTKHGFQDLIVHGGYSFSDISYAGLSFTALGNPSDKSQREIALKELAELAWSTKENFTQEIFDVTTTLDLIQSSVSKGQRVAVADIADNINGGSAGDSTHVINELIKINEISSLSTICDPSAVRKLENTKIGEELKLKIGGWSDPIVGIPIEKEATLLWFGDGTYTHEGLMSKGARYSIGKAAVVRIENMDILIQSFAQQPNDLAQFKCAGLSPADYQVIVLKGAAALRANWANQVDHFINASSLGMTDCILERLSYKKLGSTVWPLNKELKPKFTIKHI